MKKKCTIWLESYNNNGNYNLMLTEDQLDFIKWLNEKEFPIEIVATEDDEYEEV